MISHNFIIANGDTDSIAFKKPDEKPFSVEERARLLCEINSLMPDNIVWKDDKHFKRFIVCSAKNYILDDGKTVKIKGNSLKATKKEPALKEFIKELCHLLLKDKKDQIYSVYLKYVRMIRDMKDVTPWCFKVTVTKKVLDPKATFQKKQLEAIGSMHVSEGDKVYMFFREDGSLCLRENFKEDHDEMILLGKLRDTVEVFRNVIDTELIPDLTLKRNEDILNEILHDRH